MKRYRWGAVTGYRDIGPAPFPGWVVQRPTECAYPEREPDWWRSRTASILGVPQETLELEAQGGRWWVRHAEQGQFVVISAEAGDWWVSRVDVQMPTSRTEADTVRRVRDVIASAYPQAKLGPVRAYGRDRNVEGLLGGVERRYYLFPPTAHDLPWARHMMVQATYREDTRLVVQIPVSPTALLTDADAHEDRLPDVTARRAMSIAVRMLDKHLRPGSGTVTAELDVGSSAYPELRDHDGLFPGLRHEWRVFVDSFGSRYVVVIDGVSGAVLDHTYLM